MTNSFKEMRLLRGLKQSEVAEALDVSPANYSVWERTNRVPIKHRAKFAKFFELDMSDLVLTTETIGDALEELMADVQDIEQRIVSVRQRSAQLCSAYKKAA